MSVMMESWLLPVAIILNIGLAIVYNMGTNIFLGEISFITSSLAAILQLGVTMDYSVFSTTVTGRSCPTTRIPGMPWPRR